MFGFSADQIATAILGVGGVGYIIWTKIQAMRSEQAKTSADVMTEESRKEVYEQMKERMSAQEAHLQRLQGEVDELRTQVRDRDTKIHHLEMYVSDLQHILHQHGIEVPPMK